MSKRQSTDKGPRDLSRRTGFMRPYERFLRDIIEYAEIPGDSGTFGTESYQFIDKPHQYVRSLLRERDELRAEVALSRLTERAAEDEQPAPPSEGAPERHCPHDECAASHCAYQGEWAAPPSEEREPETCGECHRPKIDHTPRCEDGAACRDEHHAFTPTPASAEETKG